MDSVARRLADQFAVRPGGSYPVENMQAAGGSVAVNALLGKDPGTALLVAHSGLFCTYPLLSAERLTFSPTDDLVPIGIPVGTPMFVVTSKTSGITNLAQLRQWRGRDLHYAAGLVGASGHVGGQMLLDALDVEPVPVFYSMNRQALLDVSERRVPIGVFGWQTIASMVESNRMSVLCVLSEKRVPFAPGIPTAKEQGFNVSIEGWVGVFSRRGTTEPVIQAFAQAIDELMTGPTLVQFLNAGGLSKRHIRRPEAAAFIKTEIDRYAAIIRRYNIGRTSG